MGSTLKFVGSIKFKTENIAFLISPVYPDPPIKIIFLVKLIIEKLELLVSSCAGLALKLGILIIVHSGSNEFNSSSSGLRNILLTKRLLQLYSFITLIGTLKDSWAHA